MNRPCGKLERRNAFSAGFFVKKRMKSVTLSVQLLDPHPSVVAAKLLSRTQLQDDGKQFNMLAAAWINFMIHDWIDHLEDLSEVQSFTPSILPFDDLLLKALRSLMLTEIDQHPYMME